MKLALLITIIFCGQQVAASQETKETKEAKDSNDYTQAIKSQEQVVVKSFGGNFGGTELVGITTHNFVNPGPLQKVLIEMAKAGTEKLDTLKTLVAGGASLDEVCGYYIGNQIKNPMVMKKCTLVQCMLLLFPSPQDRQNIATALLKKTSSTTNDAEKAAIEGLEMAKAKPLVVDIYFPVIPISEIEI